MTEAVTSLPPSSLPACFLVHEGQDTGWRFSMWDTPGLYLQREENRHNKVEESVAQDPPTKTEAEEEEESIPLTGMYVEKRELKCLDDLKCSGVYEHRIGMWTREWKLPGGVVVKLCEGEICICQS
jgi:hypothetical protein